MQQLQTLLMIRLLRSTWGASTMCTRTSLGSTWTSWWGRRRAATTETLCWDFFPMEGLVERNLCCINWHTRQTASRSTWQGPRCLEHQQHFLHFIFWQQREENQLPVSRIDIVGFPTCSLLTFKLVGQPDKNLFLQRWRWLAALLNLEYPPYLCNS